ncbi:hypothetical protein I4F81_012339 [Pyropia yezoensis]|uniref:Uncharacterized protein n=1 Tax=Pyropia yezoensis TaxID=2788 RepID=A0ACC3CIW9_PYRYE|nr:hypothetical protein I4F81_012339 [Neopyropia yezoensis]
MEEGTVQRCPLTRAAPPTTPSFEGRATTEAGPGSPFQSGDDDNSHGSHVDGTVGGRDTGVARGVNLKCVKVLNRRGSGSSADIAAAFDADAGAKVADPSARIILSASLGGRFRPGSPDAMGTAARRASEAGVVVVVAAGNDGGDACVVSPAYELEGEDFTIVAELVRTGVADGQFTSCGCTHLRWACRESPVAGDGHVRLLRVPMRDCHRIVHVVPDFADLFLRRGAGAIPAELGGAVKDVREQRYLE